MIDPGIRIEDLDAEQWRRLWRILSPARSVTRLHGLLDGGTLVKLIHSTHGRLPLDARTTSDLRRLARDLREAHRVDQVVLAERRSLHRFFADVQRSYAPDQSYDEFVTLFLSLRRTYQQRWIIEPELPDTWPPGVLPLLRHLHGALPDESSLVVHVTDGSSTWCSFVVERRAGKFTRLCGIPDSLAWHYHSPLGKMPHGRWSSLERNFLPVHVVLVCDRDAFLRLLATRDPVHLLRHSSAADRLVFSVREGR